MGGIHPRLKRPVGHRLAIAAAALLHGKGPLTGPTISGCSSAGAAAAGAKKLVLKFNRSLLGEDKVQVQPVRIPIVLSKTCTVTLSFLMTLSLTNWLACAVC